MSDFKRENRYIIIKRKDLKYLDVTDRGILESLLITINSGRHEDGKRDIEAVVVESDWDIYDRVWDFVEAEHHRDG